MTLTTTHIRCGYAGNAGGNGLVMPVLRKAEFSEQPVAGTPTTGTAPISGQSRGDPLFSFFNPSAAIYVAVGPSPNASTGARDYVPAGERYDLGCDPGDKAVWILA